MNISEETRSAIDKTIVVSIDGLRSDALEKAHIPVLNSLIENGSSCMSVKTISPSITLPCHFSIFTSLAPYSHGVLTNTATPNTSASGQSLFYHIKNLGGTVSSFYSWEHLRNLWLPGITEYSLCQRINRDKDLFALAKAASTHITTQKPDFCFIYLEWVDIVGHASGWMSNEYLTALETTDEAVGMIVDRISSVSAAQAYHLVILSDHGGNKKHHIEDIPEIAYVPFIAWGKKIRKGFKIDDHMNLLNIAPTVAAILNIPPHFGWEGKEISGIFRQPSH